MTREDVLNDVLTLKGDNWLLELPTGFGKSKLAIEKAKQYKATNILLVVNRNVHKENWEQEFNKWWKNRKVTITKTTYVSLPKYKGTYDFCIMDEAHHLSERCREALCDFNIKHCILLSATVKKELKDSLNEVFGNLTIYTKTLRSAITNDILPDPKVYLIRLQLDNYFNTETIVRNPKAKGTPIKISWKDRHKYSKIKKHPVIIYCTPKNYLEDSDNQIEYWKNVYLNIHRNSAKNMWLSLCSKRLRWLSDKKTPYIITLLKYLDNYRTLTFCNNITQTELLGKYCINSKNKDSIQNLELFNNHNIDHITACNILNEGMNLIDCQVGVYANLNSSDTIIKQRIGRLLRHPKPVVIIPYYANTRDEELVHKMMEDYNKDLIISTDDYKNIRI